MPDAGYKLRLHPILVLFENFFLARLACASPSPLQPPTSAVSSRGVIMVCEHLVPFFFPCFFLSACGSAQENEEKNPLL
jgi:hypothetical protein